MNTKKILIIVWALLTLMSTLYGDIKFSDTSWDFGIIQPGSKIQKPLFVSNTGTEPISVNIINTCDCLSMRPESLRVMPGQEVEFTLFYDTKEDIGEIQRDYLVRTSSKGAEKFFYSVTGFVGEEGSVRQEKAPEAAVENKDTSGKPMVAFTYYFDPSCKKCQRFLNETIPGYEKEFDITININKREIKKKGVLDELDNRLAKLKLPNDKLPVIFIGSWVLLGDDEINGDLRKEIEKYLNDKQTERTGETEQVRRVITIIPSFLAGLIDGINPCAFSTIIMLLTSLALAGKRKKEILVMGLFFTLSVFVTYYMVGVGFFTALQAADTFPIVSLAIRWILFVVLVVFAVLSIFDYFKIKEGKMNEMIMQLPDLFKKKIKDTIRSQVRSTTIIISSLVLGFLVSIFELSCTGQIYLPAIRNMIQFKGEVFGYILLLIYNIGFILPLLLVFVLTYQGLSSKKVMTLFQKHMGNVKIGMAILFVVLAAMTMLL